jgi:hypothetical protein
MTPTLHGRWQTRFFLTVSIGVLITFVLGYIVQDLQTVFVVLGYILAFGLVWDVVYYYLQSRRWDHDWTPALYLAGAILETVALLALIRGVELPGIPRDYGVVKFLLQYGTVWVGTMLMMFGPMRVLFPRWRFRGGQLL